MVNRGEEGLGSEVREDIRKGVLGDGVILGVSECGGYYRVFYMILGWVFGVFLFLMGEGDYFEVLI